MHTDRRRTSVTFALGALAALAWPARASAQIDYRLSMDLEAREWYVEGTITNPGGGSIDFWIPRWTAGAYHLADFGRFVTDLEAFDADGNALAVERPSDSEFVIAPGGERVVVRYTGLAISTQTFTEGVIDVEANRIAKDYAYVTPVSLFGFVPDRVDEPVSLAVELPEGWEAATVLERDDETGVYRAPSYYRFEDSPLLFAPEMHDLETVVAGKPLAVTVLGKSEDTAEEIAAGLEKIVSSAATLMDGLPYSRYRFLIAYVPESQGGSGLEHSFSTLILVNRAASPESSWNLFAHEFFHLWCAERIHVEAIQRPDYTKPFQTGTIWVNEGVTEYFTQHVLLHAGLMDRQKFLDVLAGPGTTRGAASDRSWTAVSRGAEDWTGGPGIMEFVNRMYGQGPRTIFALDLEMRRASHGERGVLDLLRYLMSEYVEKGRGFPEDGMLDIIDHVAGADLSSFYDRFIDGPENPDLDEYLGVIGYERVDGHVREVASPTEEELRARADFFSADGRPDRKE